MARPVNLHDDDEDESPEPAEEIVSSSTDNLNQTPNIYPQGAAGISLSNLHNLHATRDSRVPNPYLNRMRQVRRYSLGDIPESNVRRASVTNGINTGQRHSIPQIWNGRRYSLDETSRNAQQASGSYGFNVSQRHSYPCCHINPNMLHSCCLNLKRHLSLESLNLYRRNSLPQNCHHDSFTRDTSIGYTISRTMLNPHGQFPACENQTSAFGVNGEYERQRSFSFSNSLLFGNENFQSDRYVQQGVPELFLTFLADEMDQRGLQLPEDMCCHLGQSGGEMPKSFIHLIDRFSPSLEREMIFHLTQRARLPHSLNSFVAIVGGMSNGTNSPERIVTLFFFCADLAIRAFCEGNDTLFREIVSWTQWYFRRHDTLVVPSERSSYNIAATACFVGIIAVLFLMKKN